MKFEKECDIQIYSKFGEVAEWFKAAVLKTAECNSSVSSNLTFSATNIQRPHRLRALFFELSSWPLLILTFTWESGND